MPDRQAQGVALPAASAARGGRASAIAALGAIERAFDAAFGARANPWRHLGSLAWLLFWIVAASGIYVYVAFDTRADGAYASVERLSSNAFPAGALARSLHRYASDAFALVVILHLAREWLLGRYAHFRRFSWVTGIATLAFVWLSGVGGFWLVWDGIAQYSLVATAEWLDALPSLGELARNFDVGAKVTDRFFSLLVFLHIGIPLLLLAFMWLHLQRLARAQTAPPRALAYGTIGALVALSIARPVGSVAPADLAAVPRELPLDWFYLGAHAFADVAGAAALWLVAVGLTLALIGIAWLSREARAPRPRAAIVDLRNCNGCGRCFADCPYLAVTMVPRTDGRPHALAAAVDASLCAGCGICAGACPSSTPFRSTDKLATGIDLPQAPITALRASLDVALARMAAMPGADAPRIAVFGCTGAIDGLDDARTAAFALLCAAQLPPSFVEYALRAGADGVLVAGCRECDCAFRLGDRWTEERFAQAREPHLRGVVPRERVATAWIGDDADALAHALAALRGSLRRAPRFAAPPPKRVASHADAH
jgi:coenzyme F420-reducing hydrogenase delta subunit/Pyruvate/2-oxoacid:ferredoxin oxidoreductase delta subunit